MSVTQHEKAARFGAHRLRRSRVSKLPLEPVHPNGIATFCANYILGGCHSRVHVTTNWSELTRLSPVVFLRLAAETWGIARDVSQSGTRPTDQRGPSKDRASMKVERQGRMSHRP
jgi:hypothetical protein